MSTQINGSTALVSGANRGIGLAIARALLDRGAKKVYAGARNPDSLSALVEEYGDRVVPLALDVTNENQVRQAAGDAKDVNLLINNAGVAFMGVETFKDPKWIEMGQGEYDVNVYGTYRMTTAFAPTLAANGGGTIANVVSVAGIANFPLAVSYSLSKAALHSLTQATRILLAGQGTKVSGIYPGPVDTDMAAGVETDKTSPEHVAGEILDGLEKGDEEIFPDPMAKEMGALYSQNPKGAEEGVKAMVEEMTAA